MAVKIFECGYVVPIHVMQSMIDNSKFSIGLLNVQQPNEPTPNQGTISLYEIAKNVFGLVTNNHMISQTDREFVSRCSIEFEGFGQLILYAEDIACITTSRSTELDATVIELKEQCVALLRKRGAKFLKIASARLNDRVAMVQYPNGVFSIDKGIIHEIQESTLYYYIGGDQGSSGSPILLWDFTSAGLHKAIGLHSCRKPDLDHAILGHVRVATHFPDIVAFHLITR